MSDRYLYAIVRIILFSIIAGYQILNFFFWNSGSNIEGPYAICHFNIYLVIIMFLAFVFPIIAIPVLLAINKNINKELELSIDSPSLNSDLLDISKPLIMIQDAAYIFIAFGVPNLILYLIFSGAVNSIGVVGTSAGFGTLISIQITLRINKIK